MPLLARTTGVFQAWLKLVQNMHSGAVNVSVQLCSRIFARLEPPRVPAYAGTFAGQPGLSGSCAQCPLGTYVADDGNSVCDICGPGYYQDQTGQNTCKACPEGTYNELSSSTSIAACLPAPKGNYAAGTANDGFTPCEAGYYQDQEAQASCKVCVWASARRCCWHTWLWLSRCSLHSCLQACLRLCCCAPLAGCCVGACCMPCATSYQRLAHPSSRCLAPLQPCPPGNECPAGSIAPKECKPGFYADMKAPFCKECQKGTYQDLSGQRASKTCPLGAYCANTKMSAPTLCPAGTFGAKFKAVTRDVCSKCPINVRPFALPAFDVGGRAGGPAGMLEDWVGVLAGAAVALEQCSAGGARTCRTLVAS